ncbi:MAG TPA: type II toxin-antitoxin system HicA family toxin [Candidatus Binatia bacterium]|jgi:predicted RNA binding protein YcfA (HicA-like mRNA interferase family)|nr:type II toxin-antitoxin system HicA family toxin [Candidatus Binatia bacterium]
MKLPRVTGREVVRALERAGFVSDRQRGSPVILVHPQSRKRVSVPVHAGQTVKLGTLKGILDDAGLSAEEFAKFL